MVRQENGGKSNVCNINSKKKIKGIIMEMKCVNYM